MEFQLVKHFLRMSPQDRVLDWLGMVNGCKSYCHLPHKRGLIHMILSTVVCKKLAHPTKELLSKKAFFNRA